MFIYMLIQYSPFIIFVWPSHLLMCVTYSGNADYSLDSTAGEWPQHVKFTLPCHLFTHLVFPSVCVVFSVTFVPSVAWNLEAP